MKALGKFWQSFARVLRAYTIEERVISLVLILVVGILSVQTVVEIVESPEFHVGDQGVYTEALINEQSTLLNPVYTDLADANRQISSLVFSGLTRYDQTIGAFVGDLANVEVSEDKKTYTFSIKAGAMWHDGAPVTADDVTYTFRDVIQNQDFQNPVLTANFDGVEIRKVDETTVEFILSNPNSFFITNMSVGLLPKHVLEGIPVADLPFHNFNIMPVGTGPYMVEGELESLSGGRQQVVLSRYDAFYGALPEIRRVRFNIYPTSIALKDDARNVNVISRVPSEVVDEVRSIEKFGFLRYQLPQYTAVFMNLDADILQQDKVRLALQKAIDKEELLNILPDKSPVDTPMMQLDQSEWLFETNVEEAQGALFDSGYTFDQDDEGDAGPKYRKDGDDEVLAIRLLVREHSPGSTTAQEMEKLVDFLVGAWSKIGVRIDVEYLPLNVFAERVHARDYDLLLTGQSLGYNLDTYAYWHSTQASETGLNLSNFKNFAADSIIENIRETFDNDEKEEMQEQLAEIISSEVPAIFLYRPSFYFATDDKVKNIELKNMAHPSDRFAQIADWCIVCEQL